MKRMAYLLLIILIILYIKGCRTDDSDIEASNPDSSQTALTADSTNDGAEKSKDEPGKTQENADIHYNSNNQYNSVTQGNSDTQNNSGTQGTSDGDREQALVSTDNKEEIIMDQNTSTDLNNTIEKLDFEGTSGIRNISTMQLVRDMGMGINLGNTFEACGDWINPSNIQNYETAWGSPVITEEMIRGYADAGFGVLRIPVAWSNMMSTDGTYTIHPDLINRVKQVVEWALDSGLYVIINLHWDNGWMQDFPKADKKDECMEKFSRIWIQVSEAFRDYNDYLIFEGQNEELGWESLWNRWSGSIIGKAEAYKLVNEINQKFVDIVRASGGNNRLRHLLIAGYNTDVDLTCDPLYVMPTDPAGRCAVSVHYYTPSTLTIIDKDVSWGKARTSWGNEADIKELESKVKMIKSRFIDKGIPVIIGEYGCFGNNKTRETINNYLTTVAKAFYQAKACPILWVTPNDQYDRLKADFTDKELLEELLSMQE